MRAVSIFDTPRYQGHDANILAPFRFRKISVSYRIVLLLARRTSGRRSRFAAPLGRIAFDALIVGPCAVTFAEQFAATGAILKGRHLRLIP